VIKRDALLRELVDIQYKRQDIDFERGTFRVRGDFVDIFPSAEEELSYRVEFFGDEIEGIYLTDPLTGEKITKLKTAVIYPGSHYAASAEKQKRAMESIREELRLRLQELRNQGKVEEAARLEQRTMLDL